MRIIARVLIVPSLALCDRHRSLQPASRWTKRIGIFARRDAGDQCSANGSSRASIVRVLRKRRPLPKGSTVANSLEASPAAFDLFGGLHFRMALQPFRDVAIRFVSVDGQLE